MESNRKRSAAWVAVIVVILAVVACRPAIGSMRSEARTVELAGAESTDVSIEMGAGELRLTGGSGELMEATFSYNSGRWRPEVHYDVRASRGDLEVRQPAGMNVSWPDNYRNEWDVRLNDDVPMDVRVGLGAGRCQLDLAGLSLTSVEIDAGAGDVLVDLSGDWAVDLRASIDGGVGKLTVLLPPDVGVEAVVRGGLGGVSASGLRLEGGAYVNESFGEADATLYLEIERGVGQVELDVAY